MIILKTIKWGNMFSYGPENIIHLDQEKLTQLVGVNGSGKSSIPLILEEVLTNTNSKGIKKGDILNRYSKEAFYWAELDFTVENDSYNIYVKRGATQAVKLTMNGVDISMHTATETYKLIRDLIKNQSGKIPELIYQQSSNSMDFLSSTDATRKKFLVELMGLEYDKYYENFKELHKIESTNLVALQSKQNTLQEWVIKYSKPSQVMSIVEIPDTPKHIQDRIVAISEQLKNINTINQKIVKNNQYKKMLGSLDISILSETVDRAGLIDKASANAEIGRLNSEIKQAETLVKKLNTLGDKCPTCLQEVSKDFTKKLIEEASEPLPSKQIIIQSLNKSLKSTEETLSKISKQEQVQQEFERLHSLVDKDLETTLADEAQLNSELNTLNAEIVKTRKLIDEAIKSNTLAAANNARIDTINQQLKEHAQDIEELFVLMNEKQNLVELFDILKKVFSNNGFIAYKLENILVDLENITNEYLAVMSSGRFQLGFQVSAEKLNVLIVDNGKTINFEALSSGEKARVNTATLLAIRKLMSTISSTKINLLVLDETIDTLDVQGKEQLIEILIAEPDLNTFIVSHGFTHPLLQKINVVKENNISRLE